MKKNDTYLQDGAYLRPWWDTDGDHEGEPEDAHEEVDEDEQLAAVILTDRELKALRRLRDGLQPDDASSIFVVWCQEYAVGAPGALEITELGLKTLRLAEDVVMHGHHQEAS